MSLPRRVVPGTTYVLSRRTTRRYFLFRPDEDRTMENIYWYCLALAANEHNVRVHAANQQSNHDHEVITDVDGVLPDFLRDFHRRLACATKAHRGWPAEVFDKEQTSTVEPVTRNKLVEEMAYVIANAPLSGLCRYSRDWPGAMTRVGDIGVRTITVARPDAWFDPDNDRWPEVVELEIVMPAALLDEYGSVEAAQAAIALEVERYEKKALDEVKRTRRSFLGAERAKRVAITERGKKWEVFGARNPTFAAGGDVEAALEAVDEVRAFRTAYRAALMRWRAGERDVVFPFGTWDLRVRHHAKCEPRPPPD